MRVFRQIRPSTLTRKKRSWSDLIGPSSWLLYSLLFTLSFLPLQITHNDTPCIMHLGWINLAWLSNCRSHESVLLIYFLVKSSFTSAYSMLDVIRTVLKIMWCQPFWEAKSIALSKLFAGNISTTNRYFYKKYDDQKSWTFWGLFHIKNHATTSLPRQISLGDVCREILLFTAHTFALQYYLSCHHDTFSINLKNWGPKNFPDVVPPSDDILLPLLLHGLHTGDGCWCRRIVWKIWSCDTSRLSLYYVPLSDNHGARIIEDSTYANLMWNEVQRQCLCHSYRRRYLLIEVYLHSFSDDGCYN